MEKLRSTVAKIGATADDRLSNIPLFQRSLLPFLSFASYLYRLSLSLRCCLFLSGLFPRHRLPVPVISVGNLTWGGNGKTPMVEFIARYLEEMGITPLILSRGYAGGDEAKMLQRHLLQTSAKIGVGANRSATAAAVFERYGYLDLANPVYSETLLSPQKLGPHLRTEMIGAVILDDGMQHWSLFKNVEVVMINGLAPWGNNHLIPRGSLREPLDALSRAHIGVIHHADMVSSTELQTIMSTIQKFNPSLPVFISRMTPLFVFEVKNPQSKIPINVVINMAILCVSAIGFPDAFLQGIRKIGPLHVDRLDFNDHHSIKPNDIDLIRKKLRLLENRICMEAVVLITEKDYDRDPAILKDVDDFQIMVLCSSLEIMPFEGRTGEDFKMNLKKLRASAECKDHCL